MRFGPTLLGALDRQGNSHTSVYSPFYHFNSSFDAEAVVRAHAASNLSPRPEYLTNYFGVVIHPKYFPGLLNSRSGVVEQAPIPANWHADTSEWAAASLL